MRDVDSSFDLSTVLGKVLAVLFAFRADDHGLSLAELGRRTGIAKGTLHRLVGELVGARMLERTDLTYRLSGQVFQLGMRVSVERHLLEVATPFLEDLYERTHETVHLGILDEDAIVYIAKIGGHRQASAPSRIGGRMPLHCTALGKALLAFSPPELYAEVVQHGLHRRTPRTLTAPGLLRQQLNRVMERGVAFEYEESAAGIVCVAAPVLDHAGRVLAAISVAGPATRFDPESCVSAIKAAAAGMGSTLARRAALGLARG